ncbi:MAG: hypothetical protein R3212_06845, partial [Xanthomonadales bacterium]|nr:hypothetical protein [Xanthomonadales bacterium]
MKRATLLLIGTLVSSPAWAHSNFAGNPLQPYPPACASTGWPPVTDPEVATAGGQLRLFDSLDQEYETFQVLVGRSRCAEPGRSVVWVKLEAIGPSPRRFFVTTPSVTVDLGGYSAAIMRLARQPNTWGINNEPDRDSFRLQYDERITDPVQNPPSWTFVLENRSALSEYDNPPMSAEQYNGSLRLDFRSDWSKIGEVHVPALDPATHPRPDHMPITGRLSGHWVVAGAEDQGVTLTVNNWIGAKPGDRFAQPLVLFLAHYTYDGQGKLLWLTGATQFAPGGNSVIVPIERVLNGAFMGDQEAQREVVGSVRLQAISCNELQVEFDYAAIGLGRGTHRLQRLFSLETAGHECRDFDARRDAVFSWSEPAALPTPRVVVSRFAPAPGNGSTDPLGSR